MKVLYENLPEVEIGGRKLVGRVLFGLLILIAVLLGTVFTCARLSAACSAMCTILPWERHNLGRKSAWCAIRAPAAMKSPCRSVVCATIALLA